MEAKASLRTNLRDIRKEEERKEPRPRLDRRRKIVPLVRRPLSRRSRMMLSVQTISDDA